MPLLLYILFGAVLFGGGGALLYMMPPEGGERPAVSEKLASSDPRKEPDAAQDKAVDRPAASGDETRPGAPVSPSFDIVRIEKGGDGVVAGRAEPGWTVIVESNDREVARTTADQFGEWTVVLDKPLPPGEHSIGLRALSKGAALGQASEQHVSVSIAGERSDEQTVVALSRPGEPTKVLTPKEPVKPAPEAQTTAREPAPETQTAAREPEPEAKSEPAESKSAAEAAKPQEQKPAPVPEPKPEEQKPARMAARQEETREPAPAAPVAEVAVSFSAVDYEVAGDGSGQLFLSGDAAAGARVQLYLNNERIGDAVTGPDGSWTFRSAGTLAPKTAHTMRADAVQADGQVTSRAEVEFTPPAIPEPETQVAAKSEPAAPEPEKPRAAEADAPRQPAPPAEAAKPEPAASAPGKPETAAAPEEKKEPRPTAQPEPKAEETVTSVRQPAAGTAEEKPPAPRPSQPEQQAAPSAGSAPSPVASAKEEPQTQTEAGDRAVLTQKRSIVVRRGDTLWHIAKRRYGRGTRYTAIYRDNRDQIRDPHWIYPGQEFSLPPN